MQEGGKKESAGESLRTPLQKPTTENEGVYVLIYGDRVMIISKHYKCVNENNHVMV